MSNLFAELRRRNVIRMAGLYLVGAWLIVQVAATVLPMFGAPEWLPRSIVVLLALGFVPALVFSWVYELTPAGLKREDEVAREESITARTGRRIDRLILIGLVAVVVLVAADRYWPRARESGVVDGAGAADGSTAKATSRDDSKSAEQSIAVLAFADLSPDKDQEYFADGIAEEILNALTHMPGLKVVGRMSSFKFKNVNEDLRVIGQQLGVANILEGSVRRQGDRVRISAQLVKAQDGFHLWSDTYDRKVEDVFAIQDEISRAIAEALAFELSDHRANPPKAGVAPQAYDLYLRGRQLLARRTGTDIIQAAALFDSATVIDPEFDAAWSGRARALSIAWNYVAKTDQDSRAMDAKAAAERALALNPANAEAHSALGMVQLLHLWNWDEALREMRAAIELNPNDAEVANFAGDTFRYLADLDDALTWERRASELDPLLAVNHSDLGWALITARRCEEALAPIETALEVDPDYVGALSALSRAHICLHEPDKARDADERFARLDPQSQFLLEDRALAAISAARTDEARLALEQMERRADAGAVMHFAIARAHALLGEYDAAALALERAYAERDPQFVGDDGFLLPEDLPDDPAIRAALDKPELNALFEIRRRNLAEHPRESRTR